MTDIARAQQALNRGKQTLTQVWSKLKLRCSDAGRVSSSKLDTYQLLCYDGAVSSAELTAADFALKHASRVLTQDATATYEARLALTFCAEALASANARTVTRLADYQLSEAEYREGLGHSDVRRFCDELLAAAQLSALGKEVVARNGSLGTLVLDEKHELMRDTFRDFANDVVAPLAEEIHRHDQLIPPQILDQVKALGCFGLSIPERFGGLQDDDHEDNMGMIIVTEELSRGSLGAAGSLITRPEILARALLAGGTEAQKEYWLPKLAEGDPLCGVAVTEPDYGSDVAQMKFRATPTTPEHPAHPGWLLSGSKSWGTFAGKAGLLLLLARTDPDPKAGRKGLSVFLAEKPSYDGHDFEYSQPVELGGGTLSGRAIATIGYRGMHSYDLFFDNYYVPQDALIGGPDGAGRGFYTIMAGFAGGRIQTAARACGVMRAAFERAVSYAQERKVFGQPIANYQLTEVKLARMAATLCAAREFTYGVGELMDSGKGQMEASMVKLYASRTAEWLTREAMQIHGGMGYAEETAVSRYFVDARVLSIFEGAEETLALKVVAKALVDGAA